MIEVKPDDEIDTPSVKLKRRRNVVVVNQNIGRFGIVKPWRYVVDGWDYIRSTINLLR
jgi:hypothetical protein